MKKSLILLLIFNLMSMKGHSQNNSIYAELLGNGMFGSVNYERQLTNKPILMARVGVGFWSDLGIMGSSDSGYTIPVSLNYLLDLKKNNYLEIGIGLTLVDANFMSNNAPSNILYLFTSIGFRRNFGNNLFWSLHFSPFVNNITSNTYKSGDESIYIIDEFDFDTNIWFGISIGKRF